MRNGNIRQMAYFVEPDAYDAALDHWQRVAGVGPFWTAVVRPPNQVYRGVPADAQLETAMGYLGNVQVEVIRPLDDTPSPWGDWRQPGMVVPIGGHFHHFMIETEQFQATLERLVEGGAELALTALPPGGGGFAYLDARTTFGSWIEVMERRDFRDIALQMMRDETRDWDGVTDPRRDYFRLISAAQAALRRASGNARAQPS